VYTCVCVCVCAGADAKLLLTFRIEGNVIILYVSVYISVSYLCFRGSFTPKSVVPAAFYYNNKRVRFIIVHTQYHYTYIMHDIIVYGYLLFTKTSDVELTHAVVYNIIAVAADDVCTYRCTFFMFTPFAKFTCQNYMVLFTKLQTHTCTLNVLYV